jgi:hypothetical protein
MFNSNSPPPGWLKRQWHNRERTSLYRGGWKDQTGLSYYPSESRGFLLEMKKSWNNIFWWVFLNNNRTAMLILLNGARSGSKTQRKLRCDTRESSFWFFTVYIRKTRNASWVRSWVILYSAGGMKLYTWIIFTWAYSIEPLRSFRQFLFIHFRAAPTCA